MEKFRIGLISTIVIPIFALVYFISYTFIEPISYDFMTKYVVTKKLPFDKNKNVNGHKDVVLIMVDNKTIEKYRWPWKREKWCKIYNYLYEYAHPRVIAHDGLIASLDTEYPESDKKFFDTVAKSDIVMQGFSPNVANWDDSKEGRLYDSKFLRKYYINADIQNVEIPSIYKSMVKMPEPNMDALKHAGSTRIVTSFITGNLKPYARGEKFRTYEYFINYKRKILPSFALEAFMIANGDPKMVITKKYLEFPELNYKIKHKVTKFQTIVPFKFYDIEKDYEGESYTHAKYSAVDILDSYDNLQKGATALINPKTFKNKIVIIGANAEGVQDSWATSIMPTHPGADIQATAIDNILHNDFLKIVPNWLNILITIIGLISVYLTSRYNKLLEALVHILAMILGYILVSSICYYYSVVINVITPIIVSLIGVAVAYTHKYFVENRDKEKVKAVMGMYMSEDVMEKVLQNIDELGLGGKKATVTVLFSDIRSFTSISENMTAQEVSELLNEYFGEMEPIVSKYNGIVNKYIGDSIMAVFGEPIQDEHHAENAVKCGYEMLMKVKELDRRWEEEGKPKIRIGVGVNTGEVFVGNIGSKKRMEYTVIGDTVNLASRLESYNKIYKTSMLVSSSTYSHIKKIADVVKIPEVEIRGKANKVDIYEILRVQLEEEKEENDTSQA